MQLAHRHIQPCLVGVLQHHHLGFALAQVHRHQALIAADAVGFVHHRVANLDLGQVFEHGVLAGAAALAAAQARAVLVELAFGDHRQLGGRVDKAGAQRRGQQRQRRLPVNKAGKVSHRLRAQAVLGQKMLQGFPPAQAFRHDQRAAGKAGDKLTQGGQRVVGAAVHRQRRQRRHAGVCFAVGGQLQARVGFQRRHQRVRVDKHLARRQQRPRRVAAQ